MILESGLTRVLSLESLVRFTHILLIGIVQGMESKQGTCH